MKIAILSDIHGNATALKAVINDAKKFNINTYLLLGDYFDGGPQPIETYNIIRDMNCIAIKGNHDNDLNMHKKGYFSEWNNCCLYDSIKWTYRKLSKEMFAYIDSLPKQTSILLSNNKHARLAHGSPDNIVEGIIPNDGSGRLNELLSTIDESVLICGHTHTPYNTVIKDKYYINPGSVGQPHNILAEYVVLSTEQTKFKVVHRQVSYDINKVKKDFIKSGLLEEGGICAKMNLISIETGKCYYFAFKNYAKEYARKLGYIDEQDIPDEIWIEASKTWNWVI